jgi:hypothetical protein
MEPEATSSRHEEEGRNPSRSPKAKESAVESSHSNPMESAMPGLGATNETESQSTTMVGCWGPCTLNEDILVAMEQEGTIEERTISQWWVELNAAMPAPLEKEVVMLKSHVDRGLSLPPSKFLTGMLAYHKLQLHHIPPNSFTIIAGFVTLCEGHLGVQPRGDLFRLYFNIRQNKEAN